jgi:hypothetical protein
MSNKCEICKTTKASFGYKDNKYMRCAKHKEKDMIDFRSKMCQEPNCYKNAIYGYPGVGKIYCKEHMKPDMVSKPTKKQKQTQKQTNLRPILPKTNVSQSSSFEILIQSSPKRKWSPEMIGVSFEELINSPKRSPSPKRRRSKSPVQLNQENLDILSNLTSEQIDELLK